MLAVPDSRLTIDDSRTNTYLGKNRSSTRELDCQLSILNSQFPSFHLNPSTSNPARSNARFTTVAAKSSKFLGKL